MPVDEQRWARDRAALERLVKKYDLRWDHDPAQPYPVKLDFVGEGWAELIEKLITKLIALGWNRRVGQVKEKFGTLRFYIGEGTDAMLDAVEIATAQSATTCDRCGAPGRLDENACVVRCAAHRDRGARRVPFRNVRARGLAPTTKKRKG